MTNDERMTKLEFRTSEIEDSGRHLVFGFRHSDFFRHSSFVIRHLFFSFVPCSFYSARLLAATNTNTDNIPPLRPPRAELPPSFWEVHGTSVVLCGITLLGIICIAFWWLARKRPQVVAPPEVQAREALESLRNRPEDGALLSKVSQILRRYVVEAFELPQGELTTTEFCALIAAAQKVGPQLTASISEFLRLCDQRKFAPRPDSQPLNGVAQAVKLIELGETRRAELRRAEQPTEAPKG